MTNSKIYKFIDHEGDIAIEVSGQNFTSLMANCIEATCDIIVPVKDLNLSEEIEFNYEFGDNMNLLVQILTDIIGEFEINDTLYWKMHSITVKENNATIVLSGTKFESPPNALNVLKAVTYHDMMFDLNRGIARITFDI